MKIVYKLAYVVWVAFWTAVASSQSSVSGVVLDDRHAVLSNARVTALNALYMTSSPLVTTADSNGRFTFEHVPPGAYYLDASDEQAGYPSSPFSFYILPGQVKPKVVVSSDTKQRGIVIQLGARVAYLTVLIPDLGNSGANLIFARADLPGDFRVNSSRGGTIPVPPVPITLTVEVPGREPWTYSNKGVREISLKSGETMKITVGSNP